MAPAFAIVQHTPDGRRVLLATYANHLRAIAAHFRLRTGLPEGHFEVVSLPLEDTSPTT